MRIRAAAWLVALSARAASDSPLKGLATSDAALTTSGAAQRSQRLTLRTEDGQNIAATWYEPASRPAPAVILVHMLTRSKRDWEPMAARLASDGIGALAIDLRGHGESSGDASNLSAMVNDVRAAKRHLAARTDVIHSRIGIAGASLGASLAVLAGAEDGAVTSLALLSPSLDYRGLRIEAALRKFGSRPALLVSSDDDAYAMRSARELAKGGGSAREVLLLNGAGHGMNMFGKAPELGRQLSDWFHRTLQ